jgi:hypothetical protein
MGKNRYGSRKLRLKDKIFKQEGAKQAEAKGERKRGEGRALGKRDNRGGSSIIRPPRRIYRPWGRTIYVHISSR